MENTPANVSLPVIAILGGTGKEGPGLALRWAERVSCDHRLSTIG
jgi:predicted dinucleotide-binding enzyme